MPERAVLLEPEAPTVLLPGTAYPTVRPTSDPSGTLPATVAPDERSVQVFQVYAG